MDNFKALLKSKTFWTGIAGICTAIGLWVSGEANFTEVSNIVVTSMVGIFLKAAIIKQ